MESILLQKSTPAKSWIPCKLKDLTKETQFFSKFWMFFFGVFILWYFFSRKSIKFNTIIHIRTIYSNISLQKFVCIKYGFEYIYELKNLLKGLVSYTFLHSANIQIIYESIAFIVKYFDWHMLLYIYLKKLILIFQTINKLNGIRDWIYLAGLLKAKQNVLH